MNTNGSGSEGAARLTRRGERTERALWKTTGGRIQWARQRRGWNQTQLAKRIGTTSAAVSSWELGGPGPLMQNFAKIATATKVSLAWLVSGEGRP